MSKRRDRSLPQSISSNNLNDTGTPPLTPQSSTFLSLPRSASPSITGFLTKPSKWFSRPSTNSKNANPPMPPAPNDPPRSSSSGSRRPTISGPSDPRPILPCSSVEARLGTSRSVLDLSLSRTQIRVSGETQHPDIQATGDLRSLGRKGWSRSVDDLGRFPTPQSPSTASSNLKLSTSPPREDTPSSPTRARIEAYRNNSAPAPQPLHPHYPFPTIQTTAPAFSAGPLIFQSITEAAPSPVHNRPGPHAPFQPSRLASLSVSLQPDPPSQPSLSQPRNRTVSSFERERERDRDRSNRTVFAFPFSSTSNSIKSQYTNTVSPQPQPQPQQPTSSPVEESKRMSQIVHYTGFINRHPGAHPGAFRSIQALSVALSKGWKPYKAVLKGSKLYFYKPPSDRTLEIKELFPQGMDPSVEEELIGIETVEEETDVSTKSRDDTRKRTRVYRGRATHPELVLGEDGSILRGSSDALIHEAVFGSTLRGNFTNADDEWSRFATAMMVCIPRLVGRIKFESEFIRYGTYLISGADDIDQAYLRARTIWLAEIYSSFHGAPVDPQAWETFNAEALNHTFSLSTSANPQVQSADLDTFSPRPSKNRTHSSFISSASSAASLQTSMSRPSMTQTRSERSLDRSIRSRFEAEGLASDIFLAMDSTMIAHSLTVFHRTLLTQNPDLPLAADFIGTGRYDIEEQPIGTSNGTSYAEFFGSNDSPHWLTRYVVTQVLNTGALLASPSQDNPQVSKTHLRSDLIAQWIRIGEYCCHAGDRCSWKAIEAALCSRPIARLDKVWRRTDTNVLRVLQSWLKGDDEDTTDRMLTPWGGAVRERIVDIWQKARIEYGGKDDQWDAKSMQEIRRLVQSVIRDFSRTKKHPDGDKQEDFVAQLVRFWQTIQRQPPPRSSSLNVYLSQSLAAEPRQKCLFEPYYWQRPSNLSSIHALVPLLFTEPLPTVTLIDRDLIYRGKKESLEYAVTHPGLDEAQISLVTRMKPLSSTRRRTHDSPQLLPTGEVAGLVLRLYEGELLLLVPDSSPEPVSRPPSMLESGLEKRPSQIRVATTGLDRKSSMARRSSLPTLSQTNPFTIPESTPAESTLRVVIKAGTLDRLVDVLVSGLDGVSVAVADDNGETPLREGRLRTLKLDRDEFRSTWWLVFRSFVTPLVLFELLRKRFIISSMGSGAKPRVCLDVLSTIHHWFRNGGGAHDALGDSALFDAMKTLLETVSKSPHNASDELCNPWNEVEHARQNTLTLFITQTYRPKLQASSVHDSVIDSSPCNFGPDPPSIDEADAEIFVDNLDALAATAMRSVTQEDLFVTIDLLEVQSTDRSGWYLLHDPVMNADEAEIHTIYSHLQQIEPTSLISELGQESVYKLLPPSIRGVIRAHAVIRKFVMSRIVTPRLGLRVRQARMEMLLRTIEICRLRMTEQHAGPGAIQQTVRSFVETAIISAILSPESRFFSVAWAGVANARGSNVESLVALLSKPVVRSVVNNNKLTIDAGWLLERILEIISLPNTIDSEVEGLTLLNFYKRRYLSGFVATALTLVPYRSRILHAHLERIDMERLNNMHREVMGPPFDNRMLRDDAYHESLNVGLSTPHSRKNQRPFSKIVQSQQDKCKRDRTLRDRLLREKKAEQHRTDKREEDLHKAMNNSQPNLQNIKHHRSRRTMSSAFFHLMRPLSSAFSSTDNLYIHGQRRTAKALDFEPSSKPSLVISLAGATVTPFINNVRLYTFHLTTEDGGQYLLQGSTRLALNSWITAISQTAKTSTAKRLTYIANPPKPQLSDHIQIPSQAARRHPIAVFGVELDFLLQREAGDNEVVVGVIPRILEQCLSEIEARGLQEVGLYRIPGASSAITAMRHEFDSGKEVTFFSQDYVDIFAVCDVVKTWLRALPHAIFPEKSYQEAIQIMQIPDFEERLVAVRNVVHGLPVNNFYLLRRMCEHLERITDYEEQNHMTAQALAVLFNPTLLRSPTNDFGVLMHNMNHTSLLLQTLIIHFHRVFDGDMEQDDEVDADMIGSSTVGSDRVESRSSSVPTDAIHDHDPDIEPFPSLQNRDVEIS